MIIFSMSVCLPLNYFICLVYLCIHALSVSKTVIHVTVPTSKQRPSNYENLSGNAAQNTTPYDALGKTYIMFRVVFFRNK